MSTATTTTSTSTTTDIAGTDTIASDATAVMSDAGAIINDDGSLSIQLTNLTNLTNLVNAVQKLITAGKRYFVKAELIYQHVVDILDVLNTASASASATSIGSTDTSEMTVKGEVSGIYFADESLSLHLPAPSELVAVIAANDEAVAAGKTPTLKFVSYKIVSVADVSKHQMIHRATNATTNSRGLIHRVFHETRPELLETKVLTGTVVSSSSLSSPVPVPTATGIITSGTTDFASNGPIPVVVSKLPVGENFSVEFEIPRGASQITINLHE